MGIYDELTFGPVFVTGVKGSNTGLFRAHKGRRLIAANRRHGKTPFVGASRVNNSITDFADTPVMFPRGWITLIYNGDGGTGYAKYQPAPFSAADDVIALEPLAAEANESALLLIASILTHQCVPKFGFGYKLTLHRLSRQKIMIPVKNEANGKQVVDWDGLTRLGDELLTNVKARARTVMTERPDTAPLPELKFEPMLITNVFESMKASSAWYDKVHIKSGVGRNIYLSQTRLSNGVSGTVADQDASAEPGNCITMTLKTQATFYQPSPFYSAQNFLVFRHSTLDADSGMILVTALRRAVEKFSWGYGVSMARLRKIRIMVPVTLTADGEGVVDWEGMSRCGRELRGRAERLTDAVLEEVTDALALESR